MILSHLHHVGHVWALHKKDVTKYMHVHKYTLKGPNSLTSNPNTRDKLIIEQQKQYYDLTLWLIATKFNSIQLSIITTLFRVKLKPN